jgi:cysteinyl-tRNA synthetase
MTDLKNKPLELKLYNTLSRSVENFQPNNPAEIKFYTCGPTVYDLSHIGHYRTYVGNDLIRKTLQYLGYGVKHVMNTTDVGHLSDDGDLGEEKMEKGARKYGKTVWELAQFYTDYFFVANDAFNIARPNIVSPATENIPQIIEMIKTLETKGFAYQTDEAVYFDVTKFPNYGALTGQSLEDKLTGVREEVVVDSKKMHPADFALWFKRVGRFQDHTMHWDSPWGDGFPGWHIECSAINLRFFGDQIDIHTGGIDHIPVHHTNEIAQSEAATGKSPFSKYWIHHNFLTVDGQKMSKSLNNFYTIDDIKAKNIDPLAVRFLFMQTHYRKEMNFTWESALSAQTAYNKLKDLVLTLREQNQRETNPERVGDYHQKFIEALSDDFNFPEAIAVLWEVAKSDLSSEDKLNLLYEFDQVLSLGLKEIEAVKIPDDILTLVKDRDEAKRQNNFTLSDQLRDQLKAKGYQIEDTPEGSRVKPVM